ncbi:hypothetical protein [Hymenobacter perfusus]|uniref:Uncharacterized protein n=1 Tax=Hymenobacter perfusus TaxID=1236770 RepID=A0A3R9NS91_9BACT|nr:hypothetical protein [Hymenobacter perfusus]RSK42447.1 hypothetical protein EI293_16155 [Hymenobacter perfusus]
MDSLSEAPKQPFTLEQAGDWTRRFREQSEHAVKGHLFDRAVLETLLARSEAAGLRFYYGRDEENQPQLVMVAVDADGNDLVNSTPQRMPAETESMLMATASLSSSDDETIVGPGKTCPPCCSTTNLLNS